MRLAVRLAALGCLALCSASFDTILRVLPGHDDSVPIPSRHDFDVLGLTATFSPAPETIKEPADALPLVRARPPTACEPIQPVPSNAAVLVERGECTFDVKVLAVQNAGGTITVVINNDDEPVHMDIHDDAPERPTIPALMVNATDGARLRRLVQTTTSRDGAPLPPPGVLLTPLELADGAEEEETATLTEGALILVTLLGLGVGLSSDAAVRRTEWLHGGLGSRALLSALDLLGRLLLASTFAEDGLRVLLKWGRQVRVVALSVGPSARALLAIRAALAFSAAVQLPCAAALVIGRGVVPACVLLLLWLGLQPVLYNQLDNWELLMSSAAVGGGLLFLLAHHAMGTAGREARMGKGAPAGVGARARSALAVSGRLLLVSLNVFQSFEPLHDLMAHRHHHAAGQLWTIGTAVDALVLLLALTLCGRVVLGLQSRLSARAHRARDRRRARLRPARARAHRTPPCARGRHAREQAMPLLLTLLVTSVFNYNFWHPHLRAYTLHASGAARGAHSRAAPSRARPPPEHAARVRVRPRRAPRPCRDARGGRAALHVLPDALRDRWARARRRARLGRHAGGRPASDLVVEQREPRRVSEPARQRAAARRQDRLSALRGLRLPWRAQGAARLLMPAPLPGTRATGTTTRVP